MRVVILAALLGIMTAAASFHADGAAPNGAAPALAVGYLLLTAFFLGAIFKQLRLPKLTGYLAAGIAAGHSGLDLIPHAALDDLQIFTGVAVALIALTAGTELEFRSMRPLMKSIFWVTLIAVVGGALALSLAVLALSGLLPFMGDLTFVQTAAVALVLGVVMAAQSPAVVVALRTEMAADGPICRTVLGVVVIADLVVIVMFAGSSTLANAVVGGEGGGIGGTILHLLWELGGSIVVGLFVGVLIGLYLGRVRDGAPLFVVMVAFVVAEVGARIGLDPLLVALAAGVLIRNATGQGDALHHAIEGSSLPVYLVFFAVAGATIHMDVLAVVGLPAVALVLLRGGVFIAGSRVAGRIAGAPDPVRRWVGFGLLPQAGLALALSMLFAKTFPTFGAEASALTLGIVALNEMVAPVIYRFALVRSGEAGQAAPASTSPASHDVTPADLVAAQALAPPPVETTVPAIYTPTPDAPTPRSAYPAPPDVDHAPAVPDPWRRGSGGPTSGST
jgi:Kef-type K+ transport system membrane component KefB